MIILLFKTVLRVLLLAAGANTGAVASFIAFAITVASPIAFAISIAFANPIPVAFASIAAASA